MKKLNSRISAALLERGAYVLPEYLSQSEISRIQEEVQPWLERISYNEILGSEVSGGDHTIRHLAIASKTALQVALHEPLLDLIEKVFGERCILANLSFQKKIKAEKHPLKFHSDGDGGILVFIYLNGVI